jgi:hypothetical protein
MNKIIGGMVISIIFIFEGVGAAELTPPCLIGVAGKRDSKLYKTYHDILQSFPLVLPVPMPRSAEPINNSTVQDEQ